MFRASLPFCLVLRLFDVPNIRVSDVPELVVFHFWLLMKAEKYFCCPYRHLRSRHDAHVLLVDKFEDTI